MLRSMCLCLMLLPATPALGQAKPMVELSDGKGTTVQGRVESLTRASVTLMQQDGQLKILSRARLKDFRKVASKFRPYSKDQMKKQLSEELGRGFSIRSTQHYIICVPSRTRTNYGAIFENVYKSFHYQLRRRGFHLQDTEFPLVAIVFPNFRDFAAYAAKDGVRATPTLKGYYHRLTNRVAVYESTRSADADPSDTRTGSLSLPSHVFAHTAFDTGSRADLASTITHETIHQVGFNTGIHPRLGNPPKWIVEGLAMTFESPGFLSTSPSPRGKQASTRVNRERFVWFKAFRQRRTPKSMKAFLSGDEAFRIGPLDAYAQSWALTYFFMDQPSRSHKYGQYVRRLNARDTTKGYSAKDRLKDFEEAFGDVERLEVDFLRFMDRMNLNSVASRQRPSENPPGFWTASRSAGRLNLCFACVCSRAL